MLKALLVVQLATAGSLRKITGGKKKDKARQAVAAMMHARLLA